MATAETYDGIEGGGAAEESSADRMAAAVPWWFVSFLVHALVIVVSMFIVVIAQQPEEDEIVTVTPPRKTPVVIVDPPPHLDFAKRFTTLDKPVEEPVFKKDAADEPTETPDNLMTHDSRGDSKDLKSDQPFKSYGADNVIGVGHDAGGGWGRPDAGGRIKAVQRGSGNPDANKSEKSMVDALKWLSRHQNVDGSWSMAGHVQNCGKVKKYAGTDCRPTGLHASTDPVRHDYDVGLTGLSLLAFLGAGYTHGSKDVFYDGICFGDVVKGGLAHLLRRQDGDGCIGSRDVAEYMYNHAIATLALCEAYGLTGAKKYKGPAQNAVDFLIASQNSGRGWRYVAQAGENDTSVTGWAVMALKSADLAGLDIKKEATYEGARAWFNQVTFRPGGGTGDARVKAGYQVPVESDNVAIPGVNDQFGGHPAMTAVMTMCRIFIEKKRTAEVVGGALTLLEDPPKWDGGAIDFYYWYYGSLALFQFDGPGGPRWRAWESKMADALVSHQNGAETGDRAGSWEPVDRWSCRGGRVYATAINALTLEVYYRYASVFGGKSE